ncbi:MAG: 5'-nucleotidase C-terminal domain-containing protein, partial [Candidatus Aminicenantes bacterium]|nr:5'-nucleotidase C-terminal domain-containing protein [Candidatus Aminicenantes bacterium]
DIICANVNIKRGPIPQPKPFVVFETAEGIKIAVLGLLQISRATGMPDSNPENIKGIRFEAEIETARRYRYLKKANDVFIALTHMGYEKDKKLARELGELDVIIGGHSHTIIEEPGLSNGVLIVQTGSKNRYLGKIELVLKEGRLAGKTARLIELKILKEEDPRVARMIDRYTDNPELNRVIARLGKALEGKDEIGNLMTDAIRIGLGLDLAFYNSGGIRLHFLNKTVRLKDIYALDPFDNEIIIFEMNPSEIRSLIRFDYENIKPLDLKVSGIQCKLIATSDRKVVSIELRARDGFLLDENRFYTVGMNNYMASGYHFNHRDPGHSSYRKVVDLLISYLQKGVDIYLVKQEKRMFEKIIPVDN